MFFDRTISPYRRRVLPVLTAAALILGAASCASAGRYQGLSAEQVHELGQRDFDRRKFGDAIEALDRLLLVYPEYSRAAETRFLLARAYFEDRKFLLAGDEFLRFLERHAGHFLAAEAALGVCRSYVALSPIPQRDQTYTRQASRLCSDVAREYGQHAVAEEAATLAREMRARLAEADYLVGDHYFRRGAWDSAIFYWDMLADEYWDTEWAPRALLGICRSYQKIGYDDDAEDYRLRLQNTYPGSDAAREVNNASGC